MGRAEGTVAHVGDGDRLAPGPLGAGRDASDHAIVDDASPGVVKLALVDEDRAQKRERPAWTDRSSAQAAWTRERSA
jgi:hypothetical protein